MLIPSRSDRLPSKSPSGVAISGGSRTPHHGAASKESDIALAISSVCALSRGERLWPRLRSGKVWFSARRLTIAPPPLVDCVAAPHATSRLHGLLVSHHVCKHDRTLRVSAGSPPAAPGAQYQCDL
jgi:hypothetical protein